MMAKKHRSKSSKAHGRQSPVLHGKRENPFLLVIAIGSLVVLLILIYLFMNITGILDAIRSYRNPSSSINMTDVTENTTIDEVIQGDTQERYFGLTTSQKAYVAKATQAIVDTIYNETLGTGYNSSNLPCFDSDSGANFFNKGVTVGFWAADSEPYTYEPSFQQDLCNEDVLYEMVCKPVSRKPLIQKMIGLTFNCPNGCYDGACSCSIDQDCGSGYICNSAVCQSIV